MLTLNQLAHALALEKHGSFRRAAEAQHISQPAFSRSIQNLEASLGTTLFDRHSSGIKPTIYGKALLKRADTMLIEALEIERDCQLLKTHDIGSFSVAMGIIAAETSGSRAVAEMVRLHPDLHCHIIVENWRRIEEMVQDRLVDIGLAGIYYKEENKQLQVDSVADHEFVFYCRSGHPLLKEKKLSKSDLNAYPLASTHLPPEMSSNFPGKVNPEKKSGGLIPSINTEDQTATRIIVAGSNAFSATTPVQIEALLRSGELKVLDYHEPWMKVRYGFIYRKDRMLAPAVEAFMQHVCEIETEISQRNQELIKDYSPKMVEA